MTINLFTISESQAKGYRLLVKAKVCKFILSNLIIFIFFNQSVSLLLIISLLQSLPIFAFSDTKENAGDLETIETGIDAVSQSTQAPNCGSYHENPDFHPLVKQGIERHESYDSANFLEESKKECSDKKLASNETQEKALSLSALESSPSNQQSLDVTGKGTRNNQVFVFFIIEIHFKDCKFILNAMLNF